ncbi:MAG: GNAT family N-acetyltransferase [Roseibium sp.]|uniref:GNAT family N-acetyltransferase n=1 Tax=Roseibium sp. TaxID=1936156 RepID=UPI00260BD93F|nr:GNAT family N-acetyltransferase [Roseibium sp.]MCV0423915.1 GNAT family N-acetyltransferase [Roseibium sp.]
MKVGLVETMDQLQAYKNVWCDVYQRDPESQFYLSWWWLTDFLSRSDEDWVVLTAAPEETSQPVAFLPLRVKLKRRKKSGIFVNGFIMAGNYAADYTGLLCLPEFEDEAIPAFARHLKTMAWAFLNLDYLRMSEKRKGLFLGEFPKKTFGFKSLPSVNKKDNVNNLICPYVDLPDSFDAYLAEKLSANSRQKLRRLLRKVDAGDDYRITHADADSIDRDIETLLKFWEAQWASRKGEYLKKILSNNRILLRSGFELGHLYMPVLWKGDQPHGVLGSFLDHEKKAVLFMISGRDPSFNEIPSGLLLHAHSIRHAIETGFRTYDFLRGNEPYKYSFGCQERAIERITVSTKSGVNLGGRLAARTVPLVFKQVLLLHKKRYRDEAEIGYRQILETAPRHAGALYGLAQLLAARQEDAEAAQLFETLTALQPANLKAWLRLAQVYQRSSGAEAACGAYRKVLAIDPKLISAHFGLAKCLAEMDRPSEAVDVLQAIMRLPPRNEAERTVAVEATKLLSVLKPGLVFTHPLVQSIAAPGQTPFVVPGETGDVNVVLKPSEK